MITKSFVGEKCAHCGKHFKPGEVINLTNKVATCKPGTGCTQRVLDKNGVQGLKSKADTGMLAEQFHRPQHA